MSPIPNVLPPTESSPTRHAFSITPHDTNNLAHITRAIFVGTGGDLTVVTAEDETVTFKNLADGTEKQGFFKRVLTSTTATDLVGEY